MRIIVPEDIGGELRKLEGPCRATLDKIIIGKSKANQPKATFRYVITDDSQLKIPEGQPSAVGETVLETFSLQPQAMFRLNDLYKAALGERLPQGDFSLEEFEAALNDALAGTEWNLMLELQVPTDGSSTEERTNVVARELA